MNSGRWIVVDTYGDRHRPMQDTLANSLSAENCSTPQYQFPGAKLQTVLQTQYAATIGCLLTGNFSGVNVVTYSQHRTGSR